MGIQVPIEIFLKFSLLHKIILDTILLHILILKSLFYYGRRKTSQKGLHIRGD